MAKYNDAFAPGGKIVSTANQVIDFKLDETKDKNCNVQFLYIETFAQPIRFKINNKPAIHWIDADKSQSFSDIDIDKITILDAGVEFYYTAMTTEY